jgi:hypothetical protein
MAAAGGAELLCAGADPAVQHGVPGCGEIPGETTDPVRADSTGTRHALRTEWFGHGDHLGEALHLARQMRMIDEQVFVRQRPQHSEQDQRIGSGLDRYPLAGPFRRPGPARVEYHDPRHHRAGSR